MQKVSILIFVFAFGTFTNGLKILFLAPISSSSQWYHLENFVRALLNRKHDVTCLTRFCLRGEIPENYTEVLVDSSYNNISLHHLLYDANIQKQIYRNSLQFDFVISEETYHDSILLEEHHFNAPVFTVGKYIFKSRNIVDVMLTETITIQQRFAWNFKRI